MKTKIRKIVKRLLIGLVGCILLLILVASVWYFSNRIVIPASADSVIDVTVAPEADSETVLTVREKLGELRKSSSHPAVSACVAKNGRILWTEAQGYADISDKRNATVKSQFPIGSVTKPITGVAAMQLVEQGKLDLDRDVREYVPAFPLKKFEVTSRQLLSHQAGIRHYRIAWYPPLFTEMGINTNYHAVQDSLELFANDPLEFEPDSSFLYSTYGYTLLGAAMEKASNEPFLDLIQNAIFDPLEMRDTVPDKLGSTGTENWTTNYMNVSDGIVLLSPTTNCSNKWAGGGFRSTPSDLVQFGIAVLENEIVNETSRSLMFEPRTTIDGNKNKQLYGLGWRVSQVQKTGSKNEIRMIHHGGTTVGAQCVLVLFPEHEIVVAICANSYSGGSGELLRTAASIAVQFVEDDN